MMPFGITFFLQNAANLKIEKIHACFLDDCITIFKVSIFWRSRSIFMRYRFNTLIPPSHESAAVTVDCISHLSRSVRLVLRYTTVDIHCRYRRYELDNGIKLIQIM